ncbi:hypothetical protein EYF80_005220 [Liparis tanakae]|uniref:Uncharacterized protein n=1 Tax=Liparis tanakae TaxID=230148 RepID=A0A4Z2J2T6_9TELE|nr:hypothetical protein EYF80_005220 [Liparis tanakae]
MNLQRPVRHGEWTGLIQASSINVFLKHFHHNRTTSASDPVTPGDETDYFRVVDKVPTPNKSPSLGLGNVIGERQ